MLIGQTALASGQYSLDDLPGSSGRLDVLLRCIRAALLVSHGLRSNVLVYLVLRGGEHAPRVLRVDGRSAKFVRPDERSLATLVRKTLTSADAPRPAGFTELRPGVAVCSGDLDEVLADVGAAPRYWLDEQGKDLRTSALTDDDAVFFIGDHLGFDGATRARLGTLGCAGVSVGPLSLHSDDVVSLVMNELDRRFGAAPTTTPSTPTPPE